MQRFLPILEAVRSSKILLRVSGVSLSSTKDLPSNLVQSPPPSRLLQKAVSIPRNYIDAESRIRDFYQKLFKTDERNIAAASRESQASVGRLRGGWNAENFKAK